MGLEEELRFNFGRLTDYPQQRGKKAIWNRHSLSETVIFSPKHWNELWDVRIKSHFNWVGASSYVCLGSIQNKEEFTKKKIKKIYGVFWHCMTSKSLVEISNADKLCFQIPCQGVMKRAACCRLRKRQPSTSTINQTALFSVDVDHCTFLGRHWLWKVQLSMSMTFFLTYGMVKNVAK